MKRIKSIPKKRKKLLYHATRLLPIGSTRPRMYHNNAISEEKYGKLGSESPSSDGSCDITSDEIIAIPQGAVEPGKNDNVWLGGDSMLIRLEAINEANFDSLLSTIGRLNKEWEITKVIGESFLKIYF